MHFHLPKPLHGWREFIGEVSIIVLGVLIALGAEQAVEWVHRRDGVAAVEAAMNQELAIDRARWDATMSVRRCSEKRLDELEKWSRAAPPQARILRPMLPGLWMSHTSAWTMAKASDTLNHIPLKRRLAYSGVYDHLDLLQPILQQEGQIWRDIAALVMTGDDPQSRRDLRRAVVRARASEGDLRGNYEALTQQFAELRIKSDTAAVPSSHNDEPFCNNVATW